MLADYKLPGYNGLDALKLVRKKNFPNCPSFSMSGTIGEQAAIESLKAGATDYILKQKRDRLPTAVRRAVAEAGERVRREAAEEDLQPQRKNNTACCLRANPASNVGVFDPETLAILEVK